MIAERFSTFLILSKSKKGTKHLIQKEARRASRLWLGRGVNGSLFSSGKSKWYRNLESLLTEDLFHSGSEEISQDLKTLPGIVLSLSFLLRPPQRESAKSIEGRTRFKEMEDSIQFRKSPEKREIRPLFKSSHKSSSIRMRCPKNSKAQGTVVEGW